MLSGYAMLLASVALSGREPLRRTELRPIGPRSSGALQREFATTSAAEAGATATGLSAVPADATSDATATDRAAQQDARWWALTKAAASQWVAHKDARLGAALAYYSVFSIGPLIVIVIAIAGLLFGHDVVRGEVIGSLKALLGETGTRAIDAMLSDASRPREGMLATVIGVGTLVFAAIGVVVQLKDALNTVWEVEAPSGRGIWGFTRAYVLSLAGVLALGFLLLISMLVTAALSAAGKYLAPYLPEASLQVVGFAVSFAVISLLFAMMFKWLPDVQIKWRDVWVGAVATAALFEIGKFLIGLYIGKQGLESTYGAAASIVIVLIWVYYSAQIVLLGAELTNVYAKRRGSLRERRSATS